MQETVLLDGKSLNLKKLAQVAKGEAAVAIPNEVKVKLTRIRQKLDPMALGDKPYYGINTGFGALAETIIAPENLKKLQHNLIVSHAAGVGPDLPYENARSLMCLRANTLAKGHSGVRPLILEVFEKLLNSPIAPKVPCKGSVGASGDLAPLAHLALLILGIGDAYYKNELLPAAQVLERAGLKPLELEYKEGLALINGTQAMCAQGSVALLEAQRLVELADIIGACTLEGMKGSVRPFDERIQAVRPHAGQSRSAETLRHLTSNSEIQESHQNCKKVQDAYSLRCMPQVHGASRDIVAHVAQTFELEMNSATDNPLIFENLDGELDIISGGNFHGQPLAFGLDYLAMAMSELANISERRIDQMLNPALSGDLPAFLADQPGLESGQMMWQVTAASLVNENKILCHPASTDSISTSAGREDHVSMGMTSANKIQTVIENTYQVLGIELNCAMRAIECRKPLSPGSGVAQMIQKARTAVAPESGDTYQGPLSQKMAHFLKTDNSLF